MMQSMISIIIPVYNMEKYIEKCILSILRQSYSNIEIIAVDDGSKDNSGKLLDRMSENDERLKVIHQVNSGVSTARNTGLDAARGDYIIFVDADDFVTEDYVEYLASLVDKTDAEICLSTSCFKKKNDTQTSNETIEIYTKEEGTALLLSPVVMVGCWNKIYSRNLLEKHKIRFSNKLYYGEGLEFITSVSQRANCVGVGNRKVYYYRRNNDASACTKFNIESIYNGEKSLKQIKESFVVSSANAETMYKLHVSMYWAGAVVRLLSHRLKKQYIADYRRWIHSLRRNLPGLMVKKEVSGYRKLLLLGVATCPNIVMLLDNVRRNRNFNNSVE